MLKKKKCMKIKILVCSLFLVMALTACLKDTPYLDVSQSAPIIEFGLSPANGDFGPFAYGGDTAASPMVDTAIALVIASPQVLTKDVDITVAVDSSQVAAYDSASGANLTLLPANLYTLGTTVTIKAGFRVGRIPVTLNLPSFPASHNYALPLKISSGDGLLISGNSSTFMWVFQR
jgi:hypothetical protein